MEIRDRAKNIKDCDLDDSDRNIQINFDEYNYNHCSNLIYNIKNYIDNTKLIKYSSLKSESQINIINNISSYLNIDKKQILLSNSIDISIRNILKLYATHKSKILSFNPIPDNYENIFNIETDKIIKIDLDNNKTGKQDFQLESYNLSDSFNNNRTICFLSNPNRYTGYEWSENELKRMFKKYPDVLFIIDELYIDFSTLSSTDKKVYSCTNCINEFKNIIIMRTFSKAFKLTGLGISYLISNVLNIESLSKITSHKDITELSKLSASTILDNIIFYKEQIDLIFDSKKRIIEYCQESNIKHMDTNCDFILIYAGDYANKLKDIFLENNILVQKLTNNLNLSDGYIKINICINCTYIILCILDKYKDDIHNCF